MAGGRGFMEMIGCDFVTGATGVATYARNITTVRGAAGQITHTWGEACDPLELFPQVALATTQCTFGVQIVDDNNILVNTREGKPDAVGAADKDCDHYFAVWHIAFGNF